MENFVDQELVARIRSSDEEAFFLFCKRHWKSLYTPLLLETGDEDTAFECVKGLFAEIWDRRKRLPEMTTTVEEYVAANGLGKRHKGNIFNFIDEVVLYLKKRGLLSMLLNDAHLRYK